MKSRATQSLLLSLLAVASTFGQEPPAATTAQRGSSVYATNCATSFCHGPNGAAGSSAPRLSERALDAVYIERVVTYGITGTTMPAWGQRLTRQDLNAVVAYVRSLNGVASARGASPAGSLSAAATRGRDLFTEESMGVRRCAICHQAGGAGVPAVPIARVPADVAELRNLATAHVSTARVGTDTFPALAVTEIRDRTKLYDLTTGAPVLRTVPTATLQVTDGSSWRHRAVVEGYSDDDLQLILVFLRAAVSGGR